MLKFLRVLLIAVLIAILVSPGQGWAYRYFYFRHKGPYHLTARTAFLWDPASNQRYLDIGSDREVFPASTTKILTALLALEHLSLDQYVTVSQRATEVPQTKLGLRAGESCRVRDLLYALIISSSNDAAGVLAEAVAGSEEKFVDMMNARAREIGAMHSHFANPHGLPSQGAQFTTASDMALIFSQALKNDFFRQAITVKYMVIYSRQGRRFFLKSHNRTLFLNWNRHVFGKTGYTLEARFCFVGYMPRGNGILIVAVYGCRRSWTADLKYIFEHYGHINL
jgi:serine-type D-Ala-D-Ala carboxypeptidase (penicillin-binding protein 5/6)